MSSWFDSQVQRLRNMIPFTTPSFVSFVDTVIYNRQDVIDTDPFERIFSRNEVVLTCAYRGDVKTSKWYTLSWVEQDGKRREVHSQDYSLLLWRAIQTHINVETEQNPPIHPYIDHDCRQCAMDGKSLKPYYNNGHYYGHHCDEHIPKDSAV